MRPSTKPKKGYPFEIYVTLMKFPLEPASETSIEFLNNLLQQEEVDSDIFLIKLI
jgi:hypothetical protein